MQIKSLSLYNFRIYKGASSIDLSTNGDRNVIVVSGKNGFGKTTFLMSLVWCLYGKNMNEVDELYNEQIRNQGGYSKYIANSLNRLARAEGESSFHVTLKFSDIEIQAIPSKEITIRRSYDINSNSPEKLEILFDGQPNELINEYGQEIFIRDFVIPLESAKFFFFDAEKIVSLAEANNIEERKALSKAYSEVLGIKKYEDLSKNLTELQIRYKKDSATAEERKRLAALEASVKQNEIELATATQSIQDYDEEIDKLRFEEREIQHKLIQESNTITEEEIQELHNRKAALEGQIDGIEVQLTALLDLAPFAIAGDMMAQVIEQVDLEKQKREALFHDEEVEAKTENILFELDQYRTKNDFPIQPKISEFYNQTFRKLVRKHFFNLGDEPQEETLRLHDFSEQETYDFRNLSNNLRLSYKDQFKAVNQLYNSCQFERASIIKKLTDAESKGEDELIKSLREKQKEILKRLAAIREDTARLNILIGVLQNSQIQIKAEISGLTKKIQTADLYKDKDNLSKELVSELRDFIKRYKDEKKKSLEKRILAGLDALMHKKVIKYVEVEMIDEHINIRILNARRQEIPKESLSMGEKQLYATALLKALVEESNINFPVFVDSPMQKLDEEHAGNVITSFYPSVSDQVVIFPILNKELTEVEFKMLRQHIAQCYLIHNEGEKGETRSSFEAVAENNLFQTYNKRYKDDN